MVDVAMKFVTMNDIAQSVAHLSDHILATLSPKTSRPDFTDCSTSGAGTVDVYEGTLGFTNHSKFLQNLCSGPRSWKLGKEFSHPWLQLGRIRPLSASRQEKLSIFSNNRNPSDSRDEEKSETAGTKSESGSSQQNRILFEGLLSVESSSYNNPTETLLESLGDTEVRLNPTFPCMLCFHGYPVLNIDVLRFSVALSLVAGEFWIGGVERRSWSSYLDISPHTGRPGTPTHDLHGQFHSLVLSRCSSTVLVLL